MAAAGALVGPAPILATELLVHVVRALKDVEGDVRYAAVVAIGTLLKATPNLKTKALVHIVGALQDAYKNVRLCAV